jgi:hypothetical protein
LAGDPTDKTDIPLLICWDVGDIFLAARDDTRVRVSERKMP